MFREKKLPAGGALVTASQEAGGEKALTLLTVVIPARNESGCIASTVEHLHLELRLHAVPHEIIVVDDASTDDTWEVLQRLATTCPSCARCKTPDRTASVARSPTESIACRATRW